MHELGGFFLVSLQIVLGLCKGLLRQSHGSPLLKAHNVLRAECTLGLEIGCCCQLLFDLLMLLFKLCLLLLKLLFREKIVTRHKDVHQLLNFVLALLKPVALDVNIHVTLLCEII
jgi:hypothetical protein